MAYRDLREFLAKLEDEGHLRRVKKQVDWNLELGHITKLNEEKQGGFALLFENVKDYPGQSVLTSLLTARERLALALELPPETSLLNLSHEWVKRITNNRVPPTWVDSGPVQENVVTGQATVTGNYGLKTVILVDDDIDPENWDQVLYALSLRYQPNRGTQIIERGRSTPLDPSLPIGPEWFMTSRVIIDTCIPYEWKDKPRPIELDPGLTKRIKEHWDEYFESPVPAEMPPIPLSIPSKVAA